MMKPGFPTGRKWKQLSLFMLLFCSGYSSAAQIKDTLPAFKVISKEGVVSISWINAYKQNLTQVNIQRSKDSLKGFITIHSLPDPDQRIVSYIDKTAKNDSSYYRVFVLFNGANYVFTASRKPFRDTVKVVKPQPLLRKDTITEVVSKPVNPDVTSTPKAKAEPEKTEPEKPVPPPKKVWTPSAFIYTGNDGNIVIALPDAAAKKYSIRFQREDGSFLFRIPRVTETFLILDKVNFMNSGWVFFELYNGETLVEKNKFLVTRDY